MQSPRASRPATVPAGPDDGIQREELSGLAYMFWGRLIVLGLLAAWVAATVPFERSGLYFVAIVALSLLGAPPYFLMRSGIGGTAVTAVFLLLDAAILSYILIVPTPFDVDGWTPQLNLRLPSFLYLGVFLVGMSLSYKPVLVIWTGIAVITTWTAGYLWVAGLPDSLLFTANDVLGHGLGLEAITAQFLDPDAVPLTRLSNQIVFLVLVTLILTLTVWRSRRLVRRQVAAEAQHTALSRYFSPNIVRELSTNDGALDAPAVQPVAVLFADMVGFTTISEKLAPNELIALLREFHGRLGRTAFAHGGTVDKYIGDEIMVHFGTPHPQKDDPVRALTCAADMVAAIEAWNQERALDGLPAIKVGIGLHYGEVIVGNIGDERRLEYTVLGDTVNVASRLEDLTRKLGVSLVVSNALVLAVRACGTDPSRLVPGIRPDETSFVRGRSEKVEIWCAGSL